MMAVVVTLLWSAAVFIAPLRLMMWPDARLEAMRLPKSATRIALVVTVDWDP